ncbi:MAG: carbamate kinase [Atopobiaceae bacterium]
MEDVSARSKRMVIALGGNAILTDDPSADAQIKALERTCAQIVPLIQAGKEVIITHGNGPQVGNLLLQQLQGSSDHSPAMPLDTCVAMTQGSIGYWTVLALKTELKRAGLDRRVDVLMTTTAVSADDPAFSHPTKPIGPFLTEDEARRAHEIDGCTYVEDSGRGWRKVVASPTPLDVPGSACIPELAARGDIVVCVGGGGIPVIETDDGFKGVEGVIDKDLTAEKLAEIVDADLLVICTGVDNVCVDFNKPTERPLGRVSCEELEGFIAENQFPKGSMLPKIQACMKFVRSSAFRSAVITSLEKLSRIDEGAGTRIVS